MSYHDMRVFVVEASHAIQRGEQTFQTWTDKEDIIDRTGQDIHIVVFIIPEDSQSHPSIRSMKPSLQCPPAEYRQQRPDFACLRQGRQPC